MDQKKYSQKLTLVLPAYNEEMTIASVIRDFHNQIPDAHFCVVDNNSSDRTSEVVTQTFKELGIPEERALLLHENRQGKANAMKKAFYNLDSDIFILVDADNTYPAKANHTLLQPVLDGKADIVIGERHSTGDYGKENKRPLHGFGNNLVKNLINFLFKSDLKDILSGYRIMT